MIIHTNAPTWAKRYDGAKFHALLCDPPYELGFMGRDWDKTGVAFDPSTWKAFMNVLHPGAFGMAFASSRGWHRLAVAIEDAGFVIHPSVFGWSFGSGFPKAARVDTQIDKAAGAEREVIVDERWADRYPNGPKGKSPQLSTDARSTRTGTPMKELPATELAKAWEGHRYGLQALKPALEPIIVFQKPYAGRPIDNITDTGAGALNIDGGRISHKTVNGGNLADNPHLRGKHRAGLEGFSPGQEYDQQRTREFEVVPQGRWPANFILLDEEAARRLDAQSGFLSGPGNKIDRDYRVGHGQIKFNDSSVASGSAFQFGDSGGASRFFYNVQRQLDEADPVLYQAKASRKERDAGLDGERCPHPTVKPIDLTRYLATLLLPPKEYAPRRIFVPFAGVASEMIGAELAGWDEVVGVEITEEYIPIAEARIEHWTNLEIKPKQAEGNWNDLPMFKESE